MNEAAGFFLIYFSNFRIEIKKIKKNQVAEEIIKDLVGVISCGSETKADISWLRKPI